MFIGWENGPALAEESRDPRRTIPRALYLSVAIAAALLVFFAYATITGFHYDVSSIGRSSVPFLTCPITISAERPSWHGSPESSPCWPP